MQLVPQLKSSEGYAAGISHDKPSAARGWYLWLRNRVARNRLQYQRGSSTRVWGHGESCWNGLMVFDATVPSSSTFVMVGRDIGPCCCFLDRHQCCCNLTKSIQVISSQCHRQVLESTGDWDVKDSLDSWKILEDLGRLEIDGVFQFQQLWRFWSTSEK